MNIHKSLVLKEAHREIETLGVCLVPNRDINDKLRLLQSKIAK